MANACQELFYERQRMAAAMRLSAFAILEILSPFSSSLSTSRAEYYRKLAQSFYIRACAPELKVFSSSEISRRLIKQYCESAAAALSFRSAEDESNSPQPHPGLAPTEKSALENQRSCLLPYSSTSKCTGCPPRFAQRILTHKANRRTFELMAEIRNIGSHIKEYRDWRQACEQSISRRAISRDRLKIEHPGFRSVKNVAQRSYTTMQDIRVTAQLSITHTGEMTWVFSSAPGIPVKQLTRPHARDIDRVAWWRPW